MTSDFIKVFILLASALSLAACGEGLFGSECGYEVVSTDTSEETDLKITAWRVNCGATSSFVLHVTINATSISTDVYPGGPVLVADFPDEGLKAEWVSERTAMVAIPTSSVRVYSHEPTVERNDQIVEVLVERSNG